MQPAAHLGFNKMMSAVLCIPTKVGICCSHFEMNKIFRLGILYFSLISGASLNSEIFEIGRVEIHNEVAIKKSALGRQRFRSLEPFIEFRAEFTSNLNLGYWC